MYNYIEQWVLQGFEKFLFREQEWNQYEAV